MHTIKFRIERLDTDNKGELLEYLEFTVPEDADVYEFAGKLKTILQWLTFADESIDEVIKTEDFDLNENTN
jgi:hypothetical protein